MLIFLLDIGKQLLAENSLAQQSTKQTFLYKNSLTVDMKRDGENYSRQLKFSLPPSMPSSAIWTRESQYASL